MRMRMLLASSGLAVLAVVALPVAAGAGENGEEPDISHAAEECIHILEDGGEVDDCHEAPSPILPETNEIIWGGLAFLVLFVVLWRFGLPAVRNMMHQREERIRGDLERAEQAKTEAEGVLAEYQRQLAEARNEAGRIIEEARQSADQLKRDLTARAEAEAAQIRERASQDVSLATERATADLQSRMAELSIELAEKVVERSLDRDTQMALIESYINDLGNGANR
ncbi:MAG TPA: F0F1 ATP synthase subunit B [Acidimicrobiia bacterium]|nr:F0F1 ATP synthase subunit B [Acidimicrobiia bacterium]